MRFKIDWASLIVGSKFTVFSLFYFVFEGNFPITSPLYLEGRFNGGFLTLPVWGAYIWIACVAGVERGRGRGNLGARESVWRAPKFPLPLPLSTPAAQANIWRGLFSEFYGNVKYCPR